MICDKEPSIPEHLVSSLPGPEKLCMEWSLPSYINMFLPEFPHRNVPGHEHFQVRDAKGKKRKQAYSLVNIFLFI